MIELKETSRIKSWGTSKLIFKDDYVIVTLLNIKSNFYTSTHKHFDKKEMIKNISNLNVVVRKNNEEFVLENNESIFLDFGDIHKIYNRNKEEIEVIQIQFGKNYKEEDKIIIERK